MRGITVGLIVVFVWSIVLSFGLTDVSLYAHAAVPLIVTRGGSASLALPFSTSIQQSGIAIAQGSLSSSQSNVSCSSGLGKLTISKLVQDPSNLASGDLSGLSFGITFTDNGVPQTITLGGVASSASFCLTAGHSFTVSETSTPSDFTFNPSLAGDCTGTIQADAASICTITNTITSGSQSNNPLIVPGTTGSSTSNVQQRQLVTPQGSLFQPASPSGVILPSPVSNNTAQLKIVTHNINNCKPQSSCGQLSSVHPSVTVNTFTGNQLTLVTSFPGSEVGKIVKFDPFVFDPDGIQYDVSQQDIRSNIMNVTTQMSADCEGIIHAKDQKLCVVNNYFSNMNPLGQLKIVTHNINNCKSQSSCAEITTDHPYISVFTFKNNEYRAITSFPGSEVGRTVQFFEPSIFYTPPIQYDVKQPIRQGLGNVTTQMSPDCEGIIYPADTKVCTITNTINSPGVSTMPPTQTSNVTSATR